MEFTFSFPIDTSRIQKDWTEEDIKREADRQLPACLNFFGKKMAEQMWTVFQKGVSRSTLKITTSKINFIAEKSREITHGFSVKDRKTFHQKLFNQIRNEKVKKEQA